MENKIVLITGGSKGIGLEAVRRFSAKGYAVITCSRNYENWHQAVATYPELSAVDYQEVDISDREQVATFFDYIKNNYGNLSISVNNASPKIESQGVYAEVSIDSLFSTVISDFWAHAMCLHYELNITEKGGSIVNISSVSGLRPTPDASMYSAAKHGIEGLTHSVALEAIKKEIRVNSVAPGVTWTPRWQQRMTDENFDLKEKVENSIPMKRFAKPEEIVNAIEWLSSDQASYVVGHTLVVDGGMSLV